MASREELNQLRAEARRRHRAATRKVSRLKTERGVNLSGSKNDPRRDLGRIKTYNARQLRAYINDLNKFTSRSNQFVADAHGRPVPGSLWQQYKNLERQYNQRVESAFRRVADMPYPGGDWTIGERLASLQPRHPQVLSPAVNSLYNPPRRRPSNVVSERALRRLIGDMKERLKPGYFDKLIKNARDEYSQMSALLHQPDLDKAVANLTDEQFQVLWNYTSFATAESMKYEIAKDLLADKQKPWQTEYREQAIENAWELVQWASTLDLDR